MTKTKTQVEKGDTVSIEYTGTFSNGEVFDTSKDREPLQFQVGSGQVIPGFDHAVEGMQLHQEKTFTIPTAEAYGPVRKEMILEIPRNKLPTQPEPKVGMVLMLQGPNRERLPAKIVHVEKEIVAIDANHPLAGKDLTFKVKVVGINETSELNLSQKEGCCGGGSCGSDSQESCCSDSEESKSGGCSGSCAPEGCEKDDCCKKEGNSKKEGKGKKEGHEGSCCHD